MHQVALQYTTDFIISVFYLFKVNQKVSKQRSAAWWFQVVALIQMKKIKRSNKVGDSITWNDLL